MAPGGQMSHRTVCWWVAKFSTGQKQLKDAARPGRLQQLRLKET